MDQPDKRLMIEYLLGRLGPEEHQRVEESLLTDDAFFEELEEIEEDLVSQYIAGTLPNDDRKKFEQHFLSTPEGYNELRFARAMQRYTNEHRGATAKDEARGVASNESSKVAFLPRLRSLGTIRGLSVAAGVMLIVAAGIWMAVRFGGGREPLSITVAVLRPGAVRGEGQQQRVVIGKEVGQVQLRLELGTINYPAYRAIVETAEGAGILTTDQVGLEATAFAVLNVPARLLKAGDYQVRLLGSMGGSFEDVDSYYFRVLRQ